MAVVRLGALALIAVAACGRVGFEPGAPDANGANGLTDANGSSHADASAPAPTLLASTSTSSSNQALTLATSPIAADLLVVAVTVWDDTPVQQITDSDGDALTMIGQATQNGIQSLRWFESPAPASSSVTVTMAAPPSGYDVWVGAFAGVAIGAPAMAANDCLEYPPDIVSVPIATTVPGELVLDVTMFEQPLYVDATDAPFASMGDFQTGNGAGLLRRADARQLRADMGHQPGRRLGRDDVRSQRRLPARVVIARLRASSPDRVRSRSACSCRSSGCRRRTANTRAGCTPRRRAR